jgi:hypothetical protein
MKGLSNGLRRWPVILVFFIAMLLIGMSFAPVRNAIDGPLLDMIWSGTEAEARLSELSLDQRKVHFWGTVINDTLYPLAYGGFFAGVAGRFTADRRRGLVIVPAVATIVVDLAENTVQALALSGSISLLSLKTVLTPLKFGLFAVSVLLALGLALAALLHWLSRRKSSRQQT